MQGVQPLDCTLFGEQVMGLRPSLLLFFAAVGGLSHKDCQNSIVFTKYNCAIVTGQVNHTVMSYEPVLIV